MGKSLKRAYNPEATLDGYLGKAEEDTDKTTGIVQHLRAMESKKKLLAIERRAAKRAAKKGLNK